MLKLGNIDYANCFPPHAGILLRKIPFPFELVDGVPSRLNRLLHDGDIAVSPSSSIEYAKYPERYDILQDLSITSKSRVMSILLECDRPIQELGDRTVALTSASATSNVLLRILLEIRYGILPKYVTYEQGVEDSTVKADAVLTIGDLAIKKTMTSKAAYRYDLGTLWNEFTGLPFVFALWQVNREHAGHKELERLYHILRESKEYGLSHLKELASVAADRFRLPSEVLLEYWRLFSYDFGEIEHKAVSAFYGYAAQLGAVPAVPELRITSFSRNEKD